MPAITLDHVNIRTARMAETIGFYADLLGLRAGPTPMSDDITRGAWLHDPDGRPVIHLSELKAAGDDGSGAIDHVAFACTAFAETRERLLAHGLPFRENDIGSIGLKQLFVADPNGITIEMNFRKEGQAAP